MFIGRLSLVVMNVVRLDVVMPNVVEMISGFIALILFSDIMFARKKIVLSLFLQNICNKL